MGLIEINRPDINSVLLVGNLILTVFVLSRVGDIDRRTFMLHGIRSRLKKLKRRLKGGAV